MFNYANLSDYEFELLSCDIMSKKLNTTLRTFAKGRDGGIDLTDNVSTKHIVVQVKHYINSPFSALYSSLQKEVDKVKVLNPNQYYICCAKRLSQEKENDIYKLFSDYMASPENVITLNQFDSFLEDPSNSDILRKHYKLWLESTNILSLIYNRSIFIDCESLLSDITEQSKTFVETSYYHQCKQILETHRILLILGLPGVGKTITTKMLALYYASNGYKIRFTTDGEIKNLKNSISESEEESELIILDDCLGQIYFKMKETQANELISLIKYISLHPNKKLIMNSRVTIYNEAKDLSIPFNSFTQEKNDLIKTIDMSDLPAQEKALIFYNHLFFKGIDGDYYRNILHNKNYRNIVLHRNYTPRVIEYVSNPFHIKDIQPDKYSEFIIQCLDNPTEIWQNEYNRRLSPEDRLFMTTLYSLTETIIDESVFRRAYNYRLQNKSNTDVTKNYFDESLLHLNNSMVRLVDKQGKRMVGVINPSVNDFLREYLINNPLELNDIKQHCSEYIQIKRLFPDTFVEFVSSGTAYSLNYPSTRERFAAILTCICKNIILSPLCKSIISTYTDDLSEIKCDDTFSRNEILCNLLTQKMDSYYGVSESITSTALINYFNSMDLDDYAELIILVEEYNVTSFIERNEETFLNGLNNAIFSYCQNVCGEDYYDSYDISEVIDSCSEPRDILRYDSLGDFYVDQTYDINIDLAKQIVTKWIMDDLDYEIHEKLQSLPAKYTNLISWKPEKYDIDIHNLEDHIESYLLQEPDYDYEPHSSSNNSYIDPLDCIFDRF